MAMHHADLIFGVGVRFDDRTTNNLEKYCPNAKIMHIDIDIHRRFRKTSKLICRSSALLVLETMVGLMEEQGASNNDAALDAWWQRDPSVEGSPVSCLRLPLSGSNPASD